MSKRKAAASATTSTPDITLFKEEYIHRYVKTPLKFWEDGEWEIRETDPNIVVGQIIKIKMVCNRKKDVVAVVWYAPTETEGDTVCEIKIDIVRRMLLPRDYKPDKNSFFYEEPNTGCENEQNDGRTKRQRTEQDLDEEVDEELLRQKNKIARVMMKII